jgi:hypothetical protein
MLKRTAVCGVVILTSLFATPAVQADPIRYSYVALDQVALPAPSCPPPRL